MRVVWVILLLLRGVGPCVAQDGRNDRVRTGLLVDRALGYVYRPGEERRDLDSALLLLKQAEESNGRLQDKELEARIAFAYSNAYREGKELTRGRGCIEKSLALYKTLSLPGELGAAYEEEGRYLEGNSTGEIREMIRISQGAVDAYRQAGLVEKQGMCLQYRADLHQLAGNFGQALMDLREALVLFAACGHTAVQGVYDLMDDIYTSLGDFPNAVKNGLLAVKAAEANRDTTLQLCTIYNRLSVSCGYAGQAAQAYEYLKRAMAIALRYRSPDYSLVVLLNLSLHTDAANWVESAGLIRRTEAVIHPRDLFDTLLFDASRIYVYVAGNKIPQAQPYVYALKSGLVSIPRDNRFFSIVYKCLVHYFLSVGQYREARRYASYNIAFSRKTDNKRGLAAAYLARSGVDSAMGDFGPALTDYRAYKRLTDSMLNEAKSMQLAQMQVEYETDKKEQDLALLTNSNRLREIHLTETRRSRNMIVLSAAGLLGLLFAGYYFKRRSNRRLEVKQEEINGQNEQLKEMLTEKNKLVTQKDWLVREIHHRVKNNLQIIISLLNTQSEFLDNEGAVHAIQESRERMEAIAIIHQKLYQPDSGGAIDMRAYIRELVANLEHGFDEGRKGRIGGHGRGEGGRDGGGEGAGEEEGGGGRKGGRIRFDLAVEEIGLDISQSVPLGLILNEAITNAVKYAYPEGQGGVVRISMISMVRPAEDGFRVGGTDILLKIRDYGGGFPEGFDPGLNNSLGIQLMKLFAEQLEGELRFRQDEGVEVSLVFRALDLADPSRGGGLG